MSKEEILDNFEVAVDPQLILSVHGYSADKKPRPAIVEMASRVAE